MYVHFRASTALPSTSNDFVIGRANDDEGSRDAGTMTIDEFEFWSRKMNDQEIRETGMSHEFIAQINISSECTKKQTHQKQK